MDANEALTEAIKEAGTAAELARRVGVTPQALGQWDQVPPGRVLAVEAAVGGKVDRYQLRPDIYGERPAGVAA